MVSVKICVICGVIIYVCFLCNLAVFALLLFYSGNAGIAMTALSAENKI